MSSIVGWLETIGVPAQWRFFALSLGAMLTLAGLDVIGSVFAKEWTLRQHPAWFLAGLLAFGVLFAVYAASLHIAEMSVVTLGWVVFLQVGLIVIDTVRYGVSFPPGKWLAIVAILLLQVFLVLGPNGEPAG
jgi:multidrug transporter EmrE-like cation transporter